MTRSDFTLVLVTGWALAHAACGSEVTGRADSRDAATARDAAAARNAGTARDASTSHGAATAHDAAPSARDAVIGPSDAASNLGRAKPVELLVSLTNGTVTWWRSDGTLVRELESTVQGPAFGMAYDAASNLYVTHGYTADLQGGNAIEVFDPEGNRLGTFGESYDCNPHSIVFDTKERAYVGQADCAGDVLQLDRAGALLNSFSVAAEERGSLWIALADDQCTVFYTSQGANVKRYDTCAQTQLHDFNQAALPVDTQQGSGANELKLLPDGGVIVANFTEIVRLDAAGMQLQVYDLAGPDGWRGLDLDPGGSSFWTANYSTSDIVRFDIASGDILDRFNTGTDPLTVKSVLVNRPSTQ